MLSSAVGILAQKASSGAGTGPGSMMMNRNVTRETLLDSDGSSETDSVGDNPESEKLHVDEEDSEDGGDQVLDELMLSYILDNKAKTIAPPLNDNLLYHVFFLYHPSERSWVLSVIERLETPGLGFRCCCLERDFEPKTTLTSKAQYGLRNSLKTVIVLSSDFMSDTWNSTECQIISDVDIMLVHRDLLVVVIQDCDVPTALAELVYIDAKREDWWARLLTHLASTEDTPLTAETVLSAAGNGSLLSSLHPHLQSGHLVVSLKSRCYCCGRELIDPSTVPDDFQAHGIHIPPEEYEEALSHLMCSDKFRCHVWCYNVPGALLVFALLLALCLSVIPVLETEFVFRGREKRHATGLEFLHAGIVWLCLLTAYMIAIHISKKKMKLNTYKRLSFVNTSLIKYNILCGLENLGMGDCNKYFIHFFYFEIGPCLAYLQELMMRIEEASTCFNNQTAESGDVTIEMHDDDGDCPGAGDQSRVLESANITNASMQVRAEDLILQQSGEYTSLLVTKKLDRPRRSRHVRDHPCLCQFVEHKVYKRAAS